MYHFWLEGPKLSVAVPCLTRCEVGERLFFSLAIRQTELSIVSQGSILTRFVIGWENNRDGDLTMPLGPNEIRGLDACRSIASLEKI